MDGLLAFWQYIQPKMSLIVDAVAYLCLIGSIVVSLTPTLKDDNYFKAIVKFIGKYIALDKYGPKGAETPAETPPAA